MGIMVYSSLWMIYIINRWFRGVSEWKPGAPEIILSLGRCAQQSTLPFWVVFRVRGFRVQGLGLRAFRVWGLSIRGFRVEGLGSEPSPQTLKT